MCRGGIRKKDKQEGQRRYIDVVQEDVEVVAVRTEDNEDKVR